ncbi:voltage-dependent L-type calcium channel subunit alpha-1S [Striga asiatica]|uniref:Voltage-dependent L-type calcium channel subunit alpha-1S n=1 Tax=Striga asiatica TaxID=4170 RepID=A0A5A7PY22_STRAF|nr:voltage-dependent L-type calcium channel subunit alpha-1S [Striga asiatica]
MAKRLKDGLGGSGLERGPCGPYKCIWPKEGKSQRQWPKSWPFGSNPTTPPYKRELGVFEREVPDGENSAETGPDESISGKRAMNDSRVNILLRSPPDCCHTLLPPPPSYLFCLPVAMALPLGKLTIIVVPSFIDCLSSSGYARLNSDDSSALLLRRFKAVSLPPGALPEPPSSSNKAGESSRSKQVVLYPSNSIKGKVLSSGLKILPKKDRNSFLARTECVLPLSSGTTTTTTTAATRTDRATKAKAEGENPAAFLSRLKRPSSSALDKRPSFYMDERVKPSSSAFERRPDFST